jgi:predicted transcriptional regulator
MKLSTQKQPWSHLQKIKRDRYLMKKIAEGFSFNKINIERTHKECNFSYPTHRILATELMVQGMILRSKK